MYKKVLIAIAAVVVAMSPGVSAQPETSLVLTEGQIALIRTNCIASQSVLNRVHANDGLMRVNLGQQYETISARLMAPMNSRIALNKLDGLELAKTTVDFNKKLDEFRSVYQEYERTVSSTLATNCVNQPVAFYDSVSLARTKRQTVQTTVSQLNALVTQYRSQFEAFSQKILGEPAA